MALQTCNECGKEVSSSAANCPHCGKPIKKRSVIKIVIEGFLGLVAILVLIAVFSGSDDTSSVTKAGYPVCTSSAAADQFKSVFDGSQYARTMNLTAIDVVDQKKISESSDGKKLICQATIMLNNAKKSPYTFTFTPANNGQFYLEGEPVGG